MFDISSSAQPNLRAEKFSYSTGVRLDRPESSIDMLLRWSKEMDRLRGCIHACYTDPTPTGLRCVCGFAICYIDVAPTGLDAFAQTRCYKDVAPTGLKTIS